MSAASTMLQTSTIQQSCKQLRLPGIGSQFVPLAEQAEREHQSYLGYLDALLRVELEERERNTVARRLTLRRHRAKRGDLPRLARPSGVPWHHNRSLLGRSVLLAGRSEPPLGCLLCDTAQRSAFERSGVVSASRRVRVAAPWAVTGPRLV